MATPKFKLAFTTPEDVIHYRAKKGLNQTEFWGRVGTTQSGGSRYESGRNIPNATKMLLTIVYGTQKQAEAIVNMLRKSTEDQ